MSDTLATEKTIYKIRPLGKLTRLPANRKERQALKFKGFCHIEGSHFGKKVALTFDDGPSALTEMLLDTLKNLGVKATFFWVGRNLMEFRKVAVRAVEEGYTFGNHSFDHTDFTRISTEEVLREQVVKTQLIYRDTIGTEPSLLRPPFGDVTDDVIEALKDREMKTVYWSIDSEDWIGENNSAERITNRVRSLLHEEAIILMHDGGSAGIGTIEAVKSIVMSCRACGYEFVTVHELIGAVEYL